MYNTTGTFELSQIYSEISFLFFFNAKLTYLSRDVFAVPELELRFGMH